MAVQENAVYGKVPYFIHVCREGKSERMSCRLITPRKKFDNFKRALELARELTGEDAGAKVLPGFGEMTFSSYPQQGFRLLAARERLNQLIEASL